MNHKPDGGPLGAEFIFAIRDKVHSENWAEWEARGYVWEGNYRLPEDRTVLSMNPVVRGWHARVVTGDPFDTETSQPVRRPGEFGKYWIPPQESRD
jgi:hypothetical protein